MSSSVSGERRPFRAETPTGALGGWVAGEGPRVLALHGGPGLGFEYLDPMVEELAGGYEVATFQQRGLDPSTTEGSFTIDEAVADVGHVLDALGWDTAWVVGHSWGGHLVVHVARALADRLEGVLAIDPLGAVGDGGSEAFGAALRGRVPDEVARARAAELDAKDDEGTATLEESIESLSIVWPSYFADPASAPPMPAVRLSQTGNAALWGDLVEQLPGLEAALPSIAVPFGVMVGELSPMPPSAGGDTADRVPGGWTEVVPDAGHFVWHEAPGSVRAALDRLATR